MSLKAMAWAWDQKLPASQKLTLLAIADIANEQNDYDYFGGVTKLAEKQGVSRGQMSRNITALIDAGYLRVRTRGQRRKTRYHLIWPGESDVAEPLHPEMSQNRDTPRSRRTVTPLISNSISNTTSNANIAARPRNQHWDMLVATFGEPSKERESLYGKLVQQVKDDDPAEIPIRAQMLAAVHPVATIESLLKNWTWIVSPAGQAALKKIRMSKAELREAVSPSKEAEHAEIMRMIEARKQGEP